MIYYKRKFRIPVLFYFLKDGHDCCVHVTLRTQETRDYRPPEGGRLYDMKVGSGYAFLRAYYV